MTKNNEAKCQRKPVIVRKNDADPKEIGRDACGRDSGAPRIFGSEMKFDDDYKLFGHYTYRSSIVFEILVAVTIGVQLYLYFKYLDDPGASVMLPFNLLNIFFCVVGKYVWDIIRAGFDLVEVRLVEGRSRQALIDRCYVRIGQSYGQRDKIGVIDLGLAVVLWIAIVLTQQLRFVELNVSPVDAFLFYTFAAPAEETFFRYFLTSVFIIVIAKIVQLITKNKKTSANKIIELSIKIGVGFFTGILFGLAHVERYEGAQLMVIILNGIEFSIVYALIRRIDIVMFAHLFLNMQFGYRFLA